MAVHTGTGDKYYVLDGGESVTITGIWSGTTDFRDMMPEWVFGFSGDDGRLLVETKKYGPNRVEIKVTNTTPYGVQFYIKLFWIS